MIRLSPCDLHNIHTCWCHASQIRISPQKKRKRRWWKPSAVHSWRGGMTGRGGGEGRGGCCLPLLLLFSLWGLCWVSMLHVILPSSCLLSPTLLLPLSPAFSPPPSPTPPPSPSCLSPSPRGLIYGCGAPETGMTTHTFLCFVSSLACWLALWLTACTWCVFTLYLCHAVSVLPQSKNVPLFLFVLFVFVKQCVSPATAVNTEQIYSALFCHQHTDVFKDKYYLLLYELLGKVKNT